MLSILTQASTRKLLARLLGRRQRVAAKKLYYRLRGQTTLGRAALKRIDAITAERPIYVNLETRSACNARCLFCARRKVPASRATMSIALFEDICRQYRDLGGGLLGFSPVLGDPLVDPQLLSRLRLLVAAGPAIRPHLFTNGIGLKRLPDADVTFMLDHLDRLNISVGGPTRDDYRALFGVDQFEQVCRQIERLVAINRQLARPCRIALHVRTQRLALFRESELLHHWRALGLRCDDVTDAFSDWGGLVSAADLPPGAHLIECENTVYALPCLLPAISLMIMPDGSVRACGCMDATGAIVIGDLKRQTLSEVWNGAARRDLIARYRRGDYPAICTHCAYYRPADWYLQRERYVDFDVTRSFWEAE